jgi:hypothetical protein
MIVQEGSPSLAWWATPLDHVFGDTRLRQFKPKLEQFPVDAWRSPKRVLDAHPPDQHAQLGLNLRPPSPSARLPTPITAKAGLMPTHECVGPDDHENLEDRRELTIKLNEEPAIVARKLGPAPHLAAQDDQLMSERRILRLKPALRLEWRG